MAKRVRLKRTHDLFDATRHGRRCRSRHPNWHGVRCERDAGDGRLTDHIVHTAEGRRFEWLDDRTAY